MAAPRRKNSPLNHPVVVTFLILAVVAAMALAAEVLKPLALSVLLAFALTPISRAFETRLRLPRMPAVVLTVLLALAGVGAISYVVGTQLTSLAERLPADRDRILEKLSILEPSEESALRKAQEVAGEVAERLDRPAIPREDITNVRVVEQPHFRERLERMVGPYVEILGVGSFVLILILFMMIGREDLRDRVVALFGTRQVTLTTRTLDEMGQRISRYLATFAAVNSIFGLVVGLGLWLIGVEFAVLWGCLAALLRFIPYVGPAVAFILPLAFSVAEYEGWFKPVEVVALFALIETVLNTAVEPVVYGKTTGTSALGLIVAAMFWAWLWGVLGILLSTPLTVCLAVLGKEVPGLRFFSILLGEEPELSADVRFYQRLVALDADGAVETVETALKSQPRVEVYDALLMPALTYAERDIRNDALDDRDQAYIWRVVSEIVDDLGDQPEISLATVVEPVPQNAGIPLPDPASSTDDATSASEPVHVLGIAVSDTADALALTMLAQLLEPHGIDLEVISDVSTPLALGERINAIEPALVILSQVPPEGRSEVRYHLRRLRARFRDLRLVAGCWGGSDQNESLVSALTEAGASDVVTSLALARDVIRRHATALAPTLTT